MSAHSPVLGLEGSSRFWGAWLALAPWKVPAHSPVLGLEGSSRFGGLAGISSLSLSSSQSPWVGSRGSKGRISNVSSRGEGGVLFVPESVSAKT